MINWAYLFSFLFHPHSGIVEQSPRGFISTWFNITFIPMMSIGILIFQVKERWGWTLCDHWRACIPTNTSISSPYSSSTVWPFSISPFPLWPKLTTLRLSRRCFKSIESSMPLVWPYFTSDGPFCPCIKPRAFLHCSILCLWWLDSEPTWPHFSISVTILKVLNNSKILDRGNLGSIIRYVREARAHISFFNKFCNGGLVLGQKIT